MHGRCGGLTINGEPRLVMIERRDVNKRREHLDRAGHPRKAVDRAEVGKGTGLIECVSVHRTGVRRIASRTIGIVRRTIGRVSGTG